MPTDAILDRYARSLIFNALNLQPGQNLLIRSETIHTAFLERIADIARSSGAGKVVTYCYDKPRERERIDAETVEELSALIPELKEQGDWITATRGASLYIAGHEDPRLFEAADPEKLNALEQAKKRSLKLFFDAIMAGTLQWTVACAATPKWGEQVYPTLHGEAAEAKLWDTILRLNAVTGEQDPVEYWSAYGRTLDARSALLNEKQFESLHFKNTLTDFTVGLSPRSRWISATSVSEQGVRYFANRPSFELFTTPDWRKTSGKVTLTLPALIFDTAIPSASFQFEAGRVVGFDASRGKDLIESFLKTDEGAARLGEIALVGMDTPLSQENTIFYETLFDENARCHFAFGRAYGDPVDGFASLGSSDLDDIGMNHSNVHNDVMISNAETSVDGVTSTGERIAIMREGLFVI